MKHVVESRNWSWFAALWSELVARLEQTGEKIVRAKFDFRWEENYKATVWTEREKGGSK